jgi:hypothetical protein
VDPSILVALHRLLEVGRIREERVVCQPQVEHGLGAGPLEGVTETGISDQHEDHRRERRAHDRRHEHDDHHHPARRP